MFGSRLLVPIEGFSVNRKLVETIKSHFAGKSSNHLKSILSSKNSNWSPEAFLAAEEVIQERSEGSAEEPTEPVDIDPEPDVFYNPEELVIPLLVALLGGKISIPYYRRVSDEEVDFPIPFGPKMAWLAIETRDTEEVAAAIGLNHIQLATWKDGLESAHRGGVFVTPPVGDWTLVLGTPLFPRPERQNLQLDSLLERVSLPFREVQYFCNHPEVDLYVWARAGGGRVSRAFAWIGSLDGLVWEIGSPTQEETNLGLVLTPGLPPRVVGDEPEGLAPLTEQWLFQLAGYWSVDPTSLDAEFAETTSGLIGTVNR